jgi:hypothetical protein
MKSPQAIFSDSHKINAGILHIGVPAVAATDRPVMDKKCELYSASMQKIEEVPGAMLSLAKHLVTQAETCLDELGAPKADNYEPGKRRRVCMLKEVRNFSEISIKFHEEFIRICRDTQGDFNGRFDRYFNRI